MIVDKKCLGVKCLNYPNILFSANNKKPQKFLMNYCGFVFLLLIGNNTDDGIDSALHGF